jgi:septum formation protein
MYKKKHFIQQRPIILASGSKNRQQLLHSVGLELAVQPSGVDETAIKQGYKGDSFKNLALLLAQAKARAVSNLQKDSIIIAADQLCVFDNEIFDKPITHEQAIAQLIRLNGHTHQLLTAVCIASNDQMLWSYLEPATLTMRSLSREMIERYLRLEQPYQSCGSYHFEGLGKWLFKEVSAHESTVIGLPVLPLLNALIDLGFVSYG